MGVSGGCFSGGGGQSVRVSGGCFIFCFVFLFCRFLVLFREKTQATKKKKNKKKGGLQPNPHSPCVEEIW